jgi:uncharacterized phiE125 gp8 family phage protein
MSLRLITPPGALAVSLDEARVTARLDGTEADVELIRVIGQHTRDAEHETGRALVQQTYRLTLDEFPAAFVLEYPPILTVEHIKFYDAAGVRQTLHPDDYLVDNESEPGEIVPAPGRAWPATQGRINAVEVQYSCGYGVDESTVPDEIKGYILGKVAEHFAPAGTPKSEFLGGLLDRARVYA